RALRLSTMFTGMNAALAVGFWRWLGGVHSGAWERTARVAMSDRHPAAAAAVELRGPISVIGKSDWLLAAAMAAVAVIVMFDAWMDIARLGLFREELSYVLLAPVVIGWVAMARWPRLQGCTVRHAWCGLGILLFGWMTFWYGYWGDPVLWRAGAV